MSRIKIETAQNVTVEYETASIGDRIVAALLDFLIAYGYLVALVIAINLINMNSGYRYKIVIGIILYLPVFFYDFLCEIFMDGQSFGKKARNIKVIKLDGSQPTFLNYFLRWILRPIDILFTYGSVAMITILINGKGQRLGDLAANTTVVKTESEASLDDTIFFDVNKNYEAVFPQVIALDDSDIGLVKEVIDRLMTISDGDTSQKILLKAKENISQKMGIQTDMNPLTFLGTILKDYNYINNKI